MAFGFVLVGGQSSRMGRDKTRLPYRGRPMAIHQAEKLRFVCGRAALVGKNPKAFAGEPFPFIVDEAEPRAAIYGVLAALSWSPEDVNLIVGADIPRISESFLAGLLELAETIPAPVVAPVSGGKVQTLCAVWRKNALAALTSRVANGDLSLVGAMNSIGSIIIPENETEAMPGGEAGAFLNINTPEDYAQIEDETSPYARRR